MIDFDFQVPASVDEALEVLKQRGDEARVIAGGTALVILMKQRLVRPELVVSLRRIGELQRLAANKGSLHIAATLSHGAMQPDPSVPWRWPLLAETFRRVATVRIRN